MSTEFQKKMLRGIFLLSFARFPKKRHFRFLLKFFQQNFVASRSQEMFLFFVILNLSFRLSIISFDAKKIAIAVLASNVPALKSIMLLLELKRVLAAVMCSCA